MIDLLLSRLTITIELKNILIISYCSSVQNRVAIASYQYGNKTLNMIITDELYVIVKIGSGSTEMSSQQRCMSGEYERDIRLPRPRHDQTHSCLQQHFDWERSKIKSTHLPLVEVCHNEGFSFSFGLLFKLETSQFSMDISTVISPSEGRWPP